MMQEQAPPHPLSVRLLGGPTYQGPETEAEHRARRQDGDLWVFAYGSLMWQPGFPFVECRPALLQGWQRSFCILSIRYRGTAYQPGLVLGLDAGGQCQGMAYRVAAADRPAAADYLDSRELMTRSYIPCFLPVILDNGAVVEAYGYVADTDHPQYAAGLDEADRVAMIATGQGEMGACRDYLVNTLTHLTALGVNDPPLQALLTAVDRVYKG